MQSCGQSRRLCQHERIDGHAFKSTYREDCAQMPRKPDSSDPKMPLQDRMARDQPQTGPALPESLQNCYSPPQVCGSSGESRLNAPQTTYGAAPPVPAGDRRGATQRQVGGRTPVQDGWVRDRCGNQAAAAAEPVMRSEAPRDDLQSRWGPLAGRFARPS